MKRWSSGLPTHWRNSQLIEDCEIANPPNSHVLAYLKSKVNSIDMMSYMRLSLCEVKYIYDSNPKIYVVDRRAEWRARRADFRNSMYKDLKG